MRDEACEGIEGAGGRLLTALELVEAYERREVAEHPFFLDLAGRPVDLSALWVLMANLREGISRKFVTWLAGTIARIEDRRIASLLAKQLNDELGNGDIREVHSLLLDRFIHGLEPWRPARAVANQLLRAGRELAEAAGLPFAATNCYEAIGALMVGEIFAKKMDKCLADEIRRQHWISQEALKWLVIHESLEVEHAEDSGVLAELISHEETQLAALWRGGRYQWDVLWRFLSGVHDTAAMCGRHQ